MKIDGVSIRVGHILDYEGKLWVVLKTMHTQPGKGGAFMQVEMKQIRTGTKTNVRFRSDETVERAQLEQRPSQFLYADGDTLHFMDEESFEQIEVNKNIIDEVKLKFLNEGAKVHLETYNNEVILIKLPDTMVMEVAECDAVVKNQTASSSYKPAVLSNGVKITVPPFIENGEKILVNIENLEYLERSK